MDRRTAADLDNYITGHYGEDQNKGSCERCQTYTHLEEIPFHGYSLFLCNKCAAAAYREGEAI